MKSLSTLSHQLKIRKHFSKFVYYFCLIPSVFFAYCGALLMMESGENFVVGFGVGLISTICCVASLLLYIESRDSERRLELEIQTD